MANFDIDKLLNDLGLSRSDRERAGKQSAHHESHTALDALESAHEAVQEIDAESTAEAPAPSEDSMSYCITDNGLEPEHKSAPAFLQDPTKTKRPKSDAGGAFVRHNPEETPRPPDTFGEGLGTEVEPSSTAADKEFDPNRIRPTDALTPLWKPEEKAAGDSTQQDLGELLVQRNVISAAQLEQARSVVRQTPGKTLLSAIMESGGVSEESVQAMVAELNQIPFERVDPETGVHASLLEKLSTEYCQINQILPLRREGRRIVIGSVSLENVFLMDEIRRRLGGVSVRQVLITSQDLSLVLDLHGAGQINEDELDGLLADIAEDDVEVVDEETEDVDFEKQAGESPVIRYVNFIIQSALKEGASDIHIEPGETKLKVRFRIDGILFERMNPIAKMHAAIVSRLKIMANLDIAERRIPQDGRIRAVVAGRKLDLRVSTIPTVAGEKCVLRILDSRAIAVGLEQLGMSEDALTIWKTQIAQPHGIILVTGPTGSGKTTTLYASLREMDTARLNVSTVEDPVEYHLSNITQVQIHEKIGFTFATSLRSLLRQDPDVVMVGEIRDTETAKIAVQAALTGHLVLSTLHTNDAPSSVTRLINIGVEPFLIGSALNSVLAQRLVRRICTSCRVPQNLNEEMKDFLDMIGQSKANVSIGEGCDKCRQTGYVGRLGLYELLILDDAIRDLITRNPNVTEFRRMCIERGMVSLRQDGMYKVADGLTTIEEVLRVTAATI